MHMNKNNDILITRVSAREFLHEPLRDTHWPPYLEKSAIHFARKTKN